MKPFYLRGSFIFIAFVKRLALQLSLSVLMTVGQSRPGLEPRPPAYKAKLYHYATETLKDYNVAILLNVTSEKELRSTSPG